MITGKELSDQIKNLKLIDGSISGSNDSIKMTDILLISVNNLFLLMCL